MEHTLVDRLTALVEAVAAQRADDATPAQPLLRLACELQLQLARGALQTGALEAAAQHLAELATAPLEPTQQAAVAKDLQQLARAWSRSAASDRLARAEDALRQAAALGSTEALVSLAQQLQRQQRLDEAIASLQEAIRRAPQDSQPRLSLARLYARSGQPELARAAYLGLIEAAPSMKNRLTVAAELRDLLAALPPAPAARSLRIALLGNATLDHLHSYLLVECERNGLRPHIYQAGFDQYNQEILDPSSGLYAFEPDVVICAVHASRLFPGLHDDPLALSVAERRAELDAGLARLQQLLDVLTQRTQALVLVHNMVAPQQPALGILDARDELGQTAAFAEINTRLAALARSRYQTVYVVDEDRLQARAGKRAATDPRLWYTARVAWSADVLDELVGEYLRYLRAMRGLSRKCIVLDLDNTLWGGVIGEDGLAGIQLGSEAPGNAFVGLQRELDKLNRRGILLAIASKNNPADALAAIERHPDMVLRPGHFAAQRINWQEKAANIRDIAAELNIGLESLVFLDDNPVERAKVRAELPQVLVPELPPDPAEYRAAVLSLGVFDTLALTDEDRQRSQLYREQQARRQAQTRLSEAGTDGNNLEDYLADLGLVVSIEPADELNLPRIAQLTNKTNQFNLTTRRYGEAEISQRLQAGWSVYAARVKDRFGDNGLTGVLMVEPAADGTWTIDTFLLSCRVMGRKVETALLATVALDARRAGASRLRGWWLPTEKNAPAREVYREHQFACVGESPDGGVQWELDLNVPERLPQVPRWLHVQTVRPMETAETVKPMEVVA